MQELPGVIYVLLCICQVVALSLPQSPHGRRNITHVVRPCVDLQPVIRIWNINDNDAH